MLKGHGDDIYSQSREITSNFSSNIYNKLDLQALQQYLCNQINAIRSYPEPEATSLIAMLADANKVSGKNICVTNGATEAIYLIAQAFANSKTSIVIPTFSEYEDACRIHRHQIRYCQTPEEIDSGTQLFWLCNPNNPTGHIYDKSDIEKWVKKYPHTIFVFDQSYKNYATKELLNINEVCRYKNVILLHSMTKDYCIPGLRLGYFTAHADLVEYIGKYRMPWSVNQLAIEAGKFLLNNPLKQIDLKAYLAETKRLQSEIAKIPGLTVYPTQTNFFLCRLEGRKASDLKKHLTEQEGILIRDASNFRGLNEHFFRLATQLPEENDRLIKAIKAWI
ncbi:pyridoxal phosphate-dependent class II aminotransferase [Odoribacter sp. OttesenSCG-928-J03]|nr:pyridoxal phosphate-dependent class II aminotransferase [Odoribacter sp. OttesenSCG-928-J03]MDL2330533.1 pyridoxal phosphate-dependent class II aminotransferase [Odoribacter sp. OttesenSCG-928-A06]